MVHTTKNNTRGDSCEARDGHAKGHPTGKSHATWITRVLKCVGYLQTRSELSYK